MERSQPIAIGSTIGSGVEVVGDGLVELVFWNRIGLGEIEGTARSVVGGLIQEDVTLGRAPGRGDRLGPMREVEVEQDSLNDGAIGEEGEDPHLSATTTLRDHAPRGARPGHRSGNT